MVKGSIVGAFGLWMLVTPFLGFAPSSHASNDWVVGLTVAMAFFTVDRRQEPIPLAVASWLLIAGFVPSLLAAPGVYWNNILAGILFVASGLSLVSRARRQPVEAPTRRV